jgi:serine protease Do
MGRWWFTRLCISCLVAVVAAVLAGAAAGAKPPPPSPARAVALSSPGVVYIQTGFAVTVRIKLSDESATKTYSTEYGSGSGFVVNPSGTIVTARHVVKPADLDVRHFAANKLFGYLLDLRFPADADFFSTFTITGDPLATHRLAQCYAAVICTFQVTPHVAVYTGVTLGGIQTAKGLEANILKTSEGGQNNTDIAVLQVDGSNMPTIALAQSVAGVQPADQIVSLGFPGTAQDNNITQPDQKFGRVSRVTTVGTAKQIEMDLALEQGMSGGPVVNLDGRVIGVNSYYIARSTGESGTKYARSVDDVRALLNDAGKHAVRGPVDAEWVKAVDLYFGHHYTDAIPHLRQVLALSPSLPLATEYLQNATAKKGTKEDIPLSSGGTPWWLIVLIAAGASALVMGVIVLLRRRKAPAAAPAPAARPAAPAPKAPPSQRAAAVPPAPVAGKTTISGATDGLPALVVADGPRTGERFPVAGEVSLGRENADVVLSDPEMSRRHAVVRQVDGALEISDANSANGTFVNGSRIDGSRRLTHGDSIRLGGTTLTVELPVAARQDTDSVPTLVVTEGVRTGERFPVVTELSLGRENADIVLDDGEVSRRHAVVRRVDGAIEISDANSANGTFVNGSRIDGTSRLADGDVVRLGKTSMKVEVPQTSRATTISGGSSRTVVTPPPH